MKRTLITFIVTLAALFAATPYAVAYDCEVDGIYYSRISATEVEVTNKVFSDQNHAAYTGTINMRLRIHYVHHHPQHHHSHQELCLLQLQFHDKRQHACQRTRDRYGSLRRLFVPHSDGAPERDTGDRK